MAWNNFYVIVGSASAALTGLQFVVVALAADRRTITAAAARAFATPTIVHFSAVFLMSAVFSAPWHRLTWAAVIVAASGIAGFLYCAIILNQAKNQTDYKPVLEDWIWHFAIPLIVYAGIFFAALVFIIHPQPALFALGILQLVLLFAGIHNAWDSAIYIAVDSGSPSKLPKG